MDDRKKRGKQRENFTAKLSDTNLTEKERNKLTKRLETIERLLAYDKKSDEDLKLLSDTEREAVEISKNEMAREMIETWKFYGHLYRKYGRGRILFQQFGIEPFDALKKWLAEQEKKRFFIIYDDEARKIFWDYWVRDHGSFIDPADIKAEYGSKNPFDTPWWLMKEKNSDDE